MGAQPVLLSVGRVHLQGISAHAGEQRLSRLRFRRLRQIAGLDFSFQNVSEALHVLGCSRDYVLVFRQFVFVEHSRPQLATLLR